MGTNQYVFVLVSGFTSVNVTITKLFVRHRCILCFIAERQLEYFKHSDLMEEVEEEEEKEKKKEMKKSRRE